MIINENPIMIITPTKIAAIGTSPMEDGKKERPVNNKRNLNIKFYIVNINPNFMSNSFDVPFYIRRILPFTAGFDCVLSAAGRFRLCPSSLDYVRDDMLRVTLEKGRAGCLLVSLFPLLSYGQKASEKSSKEVRSPEKGGSQKSYKENCETCA